MIISGIADEAGRDIAAQIKAHKELGWQHIELRLVNGKNIASKLSDKEFDEVRRQLDENEMHVTCFASETGNWSRHINDDFKTDLDELRTAAKRMRQLNTVYIRTMSWKGDGIDNDVWRDEAVRRCRELARVANAEGIVLVHENCEGWGGLSARHMVDLKTAVDSPNFKLLYDIGNTISHGYEPWEFFKIIRGNFDYVHIKDAKINPDGGRSKDYTYCGEGDAMLEEILDKIINEDGYDGVISIEPHVAAIVHLPGAEVSEGEKYQSYIKYGNKFIELLAKVKNNNVK